MLLYTRSDWSFLYWSIGVGRADEAQREFVDRLIDLLQKTPVQMDYRKNLYEKIYQSDFEDLDDGMLETLEEEEEEDGEEEAAVLSRREMGLENFERVLASLERAGILEYEYLAGKALLQESEEALRGYVGEEDIALLRKAGFRGSERGDELDYSRIPPEKARELDQRLYELFKERKIGLYHYREPLLRIRAGEHLEAGYRHWDKECRELEKHAKERLSQVERYVETSRCRVKAILRFLGETLESCASCDACTKDNGPWEEQEPLETEELERAYRPLDTLLAYFALAEKNAWSQEVRYRYLGRRSTLMALRGKDRGKGGTLGRKYTDNRFFGHLSFIKPKELERAFEEALKQGYLEVKGVYESNQLYGLTEKGWKHHERWQRREVADVGV